MRTLQEKYNGVLEGNFSKTQFKRDAAIEMPQFVSTVNSFDDTVAILKNKGAITEAKKPQDPKYSTAKPADQVAPDVLDTGIKFELDKKYGTLDVTPEQYAKCREMAIKNLSKDVLYYVKQDSIQLDEPGEKMEKAKLNEGKKPKAEDDYINPGNSEEQAIDREEYLDKFGVLPHMREEEDYDPDLDQDDEEVPMPMDDEGRPLGEETDEAIQNIENDEYTVKRIAKLVNQVLQDADPRDETVKAYAISVKNDLESGDTSRLKRYKGIISLDDLKDDMEHYISHDVDQLEEKELDPTEKAASDKIGRGEEFTDDDAAAVADKMPKIKKDAEFKLIGEDEPDAEDLYQHDDEYLATLKQRKALKEMFKKIITKVIND